MSIVNGTSESARELCTQLQSNLKELILSVKDQEQKIASFSKQAQDADVEAVIQYCRTVVSSISGAMADIKHVCNRLDAYAERLENMDADISAPLSTDSPGKTYAPDALGWCPHNSMSAVSVDTHGNKIVSLAIGDRVLVFPCTKEGMTQAYYAALEQGDGDLIARTNAMFEIETFRETLELGAGDPDFAQLGGYHKDVQSQDPCGYESHHIPSRSVLDEAPGMLPALSMTAQDHAQTSSFRGKQNHTITSLYARDIPPQTYKESILEYIHQGSSGYINALKVEVLDLRMRTGHRYDGGISGFLDAVIDMLASKGIPHSPE